MHRVDHVTAIDELFTHGDPENQIPATTVPADSLNAFQEEICNAVEGAGIALVKADNTQLLRALRRGRAPAVITGADGADYSTSSVLDVPRKIFCTPDAASDPIILPEIDVGFGDDIEIHNLSSSNTFEVHPSSGAGAHPYVVQPGELLYLVAVDVEPDDGAGWRKIAGSRKIEILTSGTSWNPTDFISRVWAEVYGAGGGGGGGSSDAPIRTGGGGGAGGVAMGYVPVVPGTPVAYSVGTGGAAGNAGTSGTEGGNGGNSTFGTLTGNGGEGGNVDAANIAGNGGGASGGAINLPGQPGHLRFNNVDEAQAGTNGGSNFRGAGGRGGYSSSIDAEAGSVFGGGGGGGGRTASTGQDGRAGGAGRVLLVY